MSVYFELAQRPERRSVHSVKWQQTCKTLGYRGDWFGDGYCLELNKDDFIQQEVFNNPSAEAETSYAGG